MKTNKKHQFRFYVRLSQKDAQEMIRVLRNFFEGQKELLYDLDIVDIDELNSKETIAFAPLLERISPSPSIQFSGQFLKQADLAKVQNQILNASMSSDNSQS